MSGHRSGALIPYDGRPSLGPSMGSVISGSHRSGAMIPYDGYPSMGSVISGFHHSGAMIPYGGPEIGSLGPMGPTGPSMHLSSYGGGLSRSRSHKAPSAARKSARGGDVTININIP